MNHVTLTAAKIAEMVNGKLIGSPDRTISSVSGIRDAQSDQLSFIGNKKYQHQLESTKAGVVLVCPDLADAPAVDRSLIVCDNVDYAFAKVIAVFAEEPPKWPVGVHPSAVVSPEAKLGQGVSINANAVIEAGAEIGDGHGDRCRLLHRPRREDRRRFAALSQCDGDVPLRDRPQGGDSPGGGDRRRRLRFHSDQAGTGQGAADRHCPD